MSTRSRKSGNVIGAVMILLLLALYGVSAFSRIFGGILGVAYVILVVLAFLGLIIFGMYKASSRGTEPAEPMVDPTIRSIYDEETTPKDVESETPAFSCPDCGYKNPGDADFCIRCGRDLDVTDEVARY